MASARPSDCFKFNVIFWKIFGIWPGRTYSIFYKYYSATYLFVSLIAYNILLTLNLMYTPWKVDLFIREVIFYFNEVAVAAKVFMILRMRVEILEIFECLDGKTFEGNNDVSKSCIQKSLDLYRFFYKFYAIVCNLSYVSQVLYPIIRYWIKSGSLELPVCKYNFLGDEFRDTYLVYLYIYQAIGIYGHMTYNINIDSFIAGIIFMAVTQLKVINYQMTNWKLNSMELKLKKNAQETIFISMLRQTLRHYELVLKYCAQVQHTIGVVMFVQFIMASAIICVALYGFLLPMTTESLIFMVIYLAAMTSQIFVPGWLGTQLTHESQRLVSSAYEIDWLPRSQSFKRSLRIFVERANNPIQLKTYMFPLNLDVFLSIMKTAYSFFSLLRNVQDR